jgi:hypothetical protein
MDRANLRQKSGLNVCFEITAVAAVLLFGLTLVFREADGQWKTHLPGKTDSRLILNVLWWDVRAIQEGKSWHDLWQFPCLYPEANMLATSDHMLGEAILYAPLCFLTREPILAFNLLFVLCAVLNFLSAYFVARHFLGEPVPALVSAVLFAFGSYRLYQILHFQLWVHFPTPVLFLAAVRSVERPALGWPLLAGLCLVVQFYMGMYLGIFSVVMLGLMFLTLAFSRPGVFLNRTFILRSALALATAAIGLVPLAAPYRAAAQRWGGWPWHWFSGYAPRWHNLFTMKLDGEQTVENLALVAERAVCWGSLAWLLCAAGAIAVVLRRKSTERFQFWPGACIVLVVGLCCLMVNQFSCYKLLYRVVPGFQALRSPGRIALLALWPCGLLGGQGLSKLAEVMLPQTRRLRPVFGLGVVLLVLLENYHPLASLQQHWSDVRCPREEFYETVMANLPAGGMASLPLGGAGGDPYAVAQAMAARCHPAVNVYTGKLPFWWATVTSREAGIRNPVEAGGLIGEMRLRGIRYLVLDKRTLPADRLECWRQACTRAGRPWAKSVYENEYNQILDLDEGPLEACLPLTWASNVPPDGRVPDQGSIVFEPSMPLRPGSYCVTFDLEGGNRACGTCAVSRVFFDPNEPLQLDPSRPPVGLASTPVNDLNGQSSTCLSFEVPDEPGPEPVLRFRVSSSGGTLRVREIVIRRDLSRD